MPAYRSDDEKEIRDAVVELLRRKRAGSRIIHEINTCEFGNRMDLIAVDNEEIIAVEIKSKKDKLDRLRDQISGMRGCSNLVISALHKKFFREVPANKHYYDQKQDDGYINFKPPVEAKNSFVLGYPIRESSRIHSHFQWDIEYILGQQTLPFDAIHMLWRDELANLCSELKFSVHRRATKPEMCKKIRWLANGKELTRGICSALRARDCIEADPPVRSAYHNDQ